MSTVSSVGIYVNGSCNFTSYLPPDGQYTYHVTVVPGEVRVTASFIGSNVIRKSFLLSQEPFEVAGYLFSIFSSDIYGTHLSSGHAVLTSESKCFKVI